MAYHQVVMELIDDIALVPGPSPEHGATPPDTMAFGAECVFIGRTRCERHETLGALLELEYEAFAPMAEQVLRSIAREVAARHGCGFIGVRHSTGAVPVGEASVLVRVLAGHRAEAFAACREIIDRLKREAPIWKRERWERGATWREDDPVATPPTPAQRDARAKERP